jgi:hypothetical protein
MFPYPNHDVAVVYVKPHKTAVGQGYTVKINVTVMNQGDYTESFNINVYANTTSIASQGITLSSGNSTIVSFVWDTTGIAKGNYTIWATASVVQDEIDVSGNTCVDGAVRVTRAGDFGSIPTGWYAFDDLCDYQDLYLFGDSYVHYYHPLADFDNNGDVNYLDLFMFGNCYIG